MLYSDPIMSTAADDILERFDGLTEADKHEVASEILRRTRDIDLQPKAFVGSPRLVHREQLADFEKEVIGQPHDASL